MILSYVMIMEIGCFRQKNITLKLRGIKDTANCNSPRLGVCGNICSSSLW